MPVDASIYGAIQAPKQEDPLNAMARVMQIQGMRQQQDMGAMQADEYRRGVDRSNRLQQILGQGGDASALRQGGFLKESMDLEKAASDRTKTQSEVSNKNMETAHKRVDLMGQTLGWVRQNPTAQNAAQAIQFLVENGVMPAEKGQEALAKFNADPSPQAIASFAEMGFRAALSAKDQLAKQQTNNIGGQTVTQAIDPVTGKATQVSAIQNTQSPDNAATNARTAADNAASRVVTREGQKLTDDRAREFNATKVEENNIKRAEKKETADLTKNSQIASFDTMLGTLDRLSAHPGLQRSVGAIGAMPTMPGSESANFQAELNTFQSQAFLPMVAQLKGMGALSDAEGKKLTAAVGALDPKMGEQAFRDSVTRITEDMEVARARMAGKRREKGGATGDFGGKPPAAAGFSDAEKERRYQEWKAKQK